VGIETLGGVFTKLSKPTQQYRLVKPRSSQCNRKTKEPALEISMVLQGWKRPPVGAKGVNHILFGDVFPLWDGEFRAWDPHAGFPPVCGNFSGFPPTGVFWTFFQRNKALGGKGTGARFGSPNGGVFGGKLSGFKSTFFRGKKRGKI